MPQSRWLLPIVAWVFVTIETTGAAAADQAPSVSTFDSDGVQIAYLDQGQGEPVVLLQGFTGHLSQWPKMRNALLEAGYRVIAMDARGHGQSGKPHDPKLYGHQMADDVVRLLDHLHIRRTHVVGYSMGGDIANKVREMYPSRLLTVTMGGVGKGVTKGWTTSDFNYMEIAESLERGDGLKVLLGEPNGAGRRPLSASEIEEMNRTIMEGQDPLALAAVIRAYPDLEVSEESLTNNSVPTLVIVGQHDPEKPTVDELKKVMTKIHVKVIPDADHFTAGGRPEFFDAVTEFLNAHRSK